MKCLLAILACCCVAEEIMNICPKVTETNETDIQKASYILHIYVNKKTTYESDVYDYYYFNIEDYIRPNREICKYKHPETKYRYKKPKENCTIPPIQMDQEYIVGCESMKRCNFLRPFKNLTTIESKNVEVVRKLNDGYKKEICRRLDNQWYE